MKMKKLNFDVLCIGATSYDLTFQVNEHPKPDSKEVANTFVKCGGGPAANASVCVARLGGAAAFAGYLGNDLFGQEHYKELQNEGVNCHFVIRGNKATPVSSIISKPNGDRALVNYKEYNSMLSSDLIDLSIVNPKVILFDGHEPEVSIHLVNESKQFNIKTVLDAGSLHNGTNELSSKVDYLVASQKFASQISSSEDINEMLNALEKINSKVFITLGGNGVVWSVDGERGKKKAFNVNATDTTGAGDAFHGAFALALAKEKSLSDSIEFASGVAALTCTKLGARIALPYKSEVDKFIETRRNA